MSQCTCTTDKEMTCIVHPTDKALRQRIAELEALADPLTKALYEEMYKRHTEISIENHALEAELERLRETAKILTDGGWYNIGSSHIGSKYWDAFVQLRALLEKGNE